MATGVVEVEQKNTGKNKLLPVTTVTTRYHHSVLSSLFGYLSLPHSFAGTLNSQELLLEAASRCSTWKVQEGWDLRMVQSSEQVSQCTGARLPFPEEAWKQEVYLPSGNPLTQPLLCGLPRQTFKYTILAYSGPNGLTQTAVSPQSVGDLG